MTWTAADVLDAYASMVGRLRRPTSDMADFVAFFMNDYMAACRKEVMFYPVMLEQGRFTVKDGAAFARILGAALAGSPVYQVTEKMCELIEELARSAAQASVPVLRRADLPAASGFAWLDKPLKVTTEDGSVATVQVFSWAVQQVAMREGGKPAIRIAAWMPTPDDSAAAGGKPARGNAAAAPLRGVLGPVTLLFSDIWMLDAPMHPVNRRAPRTAMALLGYVRTLGTTLQAEIAGIDRPHIQRASRRRAEREAGRSDLQVITLRRAAQAAPAPATAGRPDPQAMNWPYRWRVEEHYRHHAAPRENPHRIIPSPDEKSCSVCGGAVSRIPSYTKGPEGKPLRVRRRLNRLAR